MYSTPPTNTPVGSTRRHLLTVAADGAIAAAIPTAVLAAAPTVDPIHAAIKRHRDLAKVCDAEGSRPVQRLWDMTEEEKAHVLKLNDAVDEAHLPLEAAAMDLFNTAPTTHVGIITALCYMRIQHRNDGEHMIQGRFEDEHGESYIDWRDAWLETLVQAVMQLDDAAALIQVQS